MNNYEQQAKEFLISTGVDIKTIFKKMIITLKEKQIKEIFIVLP